jgi:RNA polymerase sigma-70 factor, ECF subfamily
LLLKLKDSKQVLLEIKIIPGTLDTTGFRPAIRGFVLRMVGNDALAEDLTQETFLRAYRSLNGYRGEASEYSWLCSIALNLVRDHFRSAGRLPEMITDADTMEMVPSTDDNAEQALLQAEMSNCVAEFLTRLPQPQYEVVVLYEMGGFNHQEIGAQLGISEPNSRVLLHRGRVALREMLKQGCSLSFGSDAILCERSPQSD